MTPPARPTRVCDEDECDTILSRYSKSRSCSIHEHLHAPSTGGNLSAGARGKDAAACCQLVAQRDPLGRPPIGYCGPDCERRPAR